MVYISSGEEGSLSGGEGGEAVEWEVRADAFIARTRHVER